jgi:hypothetical protein
MMNFVGASLKSAKNGTFFVAFHRARKSYYIDMNNMKKYSEKNIAGKPWCRFVNHIGHYY